MRRLWKPSVRPGGSGTVGSISGESLGYFYWDANQMRERVAAAQTRRQRVDQAVALQVGHAGPGGTVDVSVDRDDGRLQHVVVRFDEGLPGHVYRGYAGDFKGYANDVRIAQNALAVTGACLMTRRELFEEDPDAP
jgi:hypothetical protein